MPRHEEQKVLPYKQDFIFSIVADVEKYPEFLPWCVDARVYSKKDNEFLADLMIGFKMLRETYTSKVVLNPPGKITVDYVKGPMKYLYNVWRFQEHGDGTLVNFKLDFEFKNAFLGKMMGGLFEDAVHHMVGAFEKRARALYEGNPRE